MTIKVNRREAAIAALLSATTIKQAAVSAGVSERQLHRWLRDPEFAGQLNDARRSALDQAMRALQVRMTEAVNTLGDVMADKNSGGMARTQAARAVLEYAFKSLELRDILERLEVLERNGGD